MRSSSSDQLDVALREADEVLDDDGAAAEVGDHRVHAILGAGEFGDVGDQELIFG